MGVYKLSGAGGLISGRTEYKSMNAGNQYGAMVPIAYATNGSANFYNIPQNYQDLYMCGQIRGVNGNTIEYGNIQLNSSSSNHSYTMLTGDGGSATSSRNTPVTGAFYLGLIPGGNSTAGVLGTYQIWILNYANTSTYKTVLWRLAADQNGSGVTQMGVGLWSSTAAITAMNVFGSNGSGTGTTHSLYGIRAVSS